MVGGWLATNRPCPPPRTTDAPLLLLLVRQQSSNRKRKPTRVRPRKATASLSVQIGCLCIIVLIKYATPRADRIDTRINWRFWCFFCWKVSLSFSSSYRYVSVMAYMRYGICKCACKIGESCRCLRCFLFYPFWFPFHKRVGWWCSGYTKRKISLL